MVDPMVTNRQNRFQFSHSVPPEYSSAAHFNVPDWREESVGESSIFSEEMLLSAARTGQEWAFVELCSRYSKRILFMLHRITKNREDAEDALQESMLNAFVHLGDFNQTSTFGTWFTRIGINAAFVVLRRKRARPEISTDAPIDESEKSRPWEMADRGPNPEEIYIQTENQQRLQTAIARLPKGYRYIVESRRRSDATMREIAEKAGITTSAAKTRLLRATRVLRSSMLK
jgi:RNA polymerase sigma factor (sigma-70 family)